MRAVLVGPPRYRARLRSQLDGSAVEIVGEFLTVAEARAVHDEFDAIIMAPTQNGDSAPLAGTTQDPPFAEALTPREIQVLELLAEGLPNKAIAQTLGISDQTVKFHVSSISGKLGAANRTDIVRRAVRRGLIAL
jgi:DNA-binding NarL/FixJ family response regulator